MTTAKKPRRKGGKPPSTIPETPELNALNEAIEKAGGLVKAAAKLEVTLSAIGGWRKNGTPPNRAVELEELTGVSRKRLCPRLFA